MSAVLAGIRHETSRLLKKELVKRLFPGFILTMPRRDPGQDLRDTEFSLGSGAVFRGCLSIRTLLLAHYCASRS